MEFKKSEWFIKHFIKLGKSSGAPTFKEIVASSSNKSEKTTFLAYLIEKEKDKFQFLLSKLLVPSSPTQLSKGCILLDKNSGNIIIIITREGCSLFKLKPDNLTKLSTAIRKNKELIKGNKDLELINKRLLEELVNALKNYKDEYNPLHLNVKEIKSEELSFIIPISK